MLLYSGHPRLACSAESWRNCQPHAHPAALRTRSHRSVRAGLRTCQQLDRSRSQPLQEATKPLTSGSMAAAGRSREDWLQQWLGRYFLATPPKSAGGEQFGSTTRSTPPESQGVGPSDVGHARGFHRCGQQDLQHMDNELAFAPQADCGGRWAPQPLMREPRPVAMDSGCAATLQSAYLPKHGRRWSLHSGLVASSATPGQCPAVWGQHGNHPRLPGQAGMSALG